MNPASDPATERAEKELRQAQAELDAFSYSISHDLRTPLRFIRGFAEAIAEDTDSQLTPASQDCLKRILHSADRMEVMIKDLLAYSRIGRAEIHLEPQSLEALISDVVLAHHTVIQKAGAKVTLASPMPSVRADRSALQQILGHLLSNALKFTLPGQPAVVVFRAEADGPDQVRVWVEDQGLGIEPRYHERIFKLFERLHPADQFPGSGVGLAVLAKAMRRMEGTYGVESTPGQGSRFWLRFPR